MGPWKLPEFVLELYRMDDDGAKWHFMMNAFANPSIAEIVTSMHYINSNIPDHKPALQS